MADFRMPSLGADMEEGTLLEWLVHPGDHVRKGDIVAVVDTAKAAVEVETFSEGVIGELLVEPGVLVPVGTVLATIFAEGAAGAPEASDAPEAVVEPLEPVAVFEPVETHEPRVSSPLTRKLAADLGVALAAVRGTGRGGAITREDVARAADRSVPAEPGARRLRVTPYARRLATELGVDLGAITADGPILARGFRAAPTGTVPAKMPPSTVVAPKLAAADRSAQMRTAIATLMARSKREIPHYYLSTTVDLSTALTWMRERNRELPVAERLVPAALILKAAALAVAAAPALNGFWIDDAFVPGTGVHLGVAVSLRGGGLVAPALHDADSLTVEELMARMRDLVTRARAGRLRGSEMADPTITLTNLGDQGVEAVFGVIYPPQVALIGVGRVVERPWAIDGLLGVHPVTTLTLAADHRATDGFTGARFLDHIDRLLQEPEGL
jgi:pyruvate dehydrogenase E2 component (dihydrolipoamide acetyltransferase)